MAMPAAAAVPWGAKLPLLPSEQASTTSTPKADVESAAREQSRENPMLPIVAEWVLAPQGAH
jgi:hypothetical protein